MGIIKTLLSEIPDTSSDLTQQMRIICDQISSQEKSNMKYLSIAPKGSAIFLCLEVPGRYDWEVGFLTLEREDVEVYIIVHYAIEKNRIAKEGDEIIPPRRKKVWVINENKAEKIITQYALKLKMLRNE